MIQFRVGRVSKQVTTRRALFLLSLLPLSDRHWQLPQPRIYPATLETRILSILCSIKARGHLRRVCTTQSTRKRCLRFSPRHLLSLFTITSGLEDIEE
jgi:hypothetical protein